MEPLDPRINPKTEPLYMDVEIVEDGSIPETVIVVAPNDPS